ncbi:MAG: hypothetical protein AMXMBFR7_00390 [Planctomycetota bacterium]
MAKTKALPLAPLARHSTDELLDELERRSLGCLVVSLRVEEPNADAWRYRIKGSNVLLGAMSAALTVRMHCVLTERAEWNDDPFAGSVV